MPLAVPQQYHACMHDSNRIVSQLKWRSHGVSGVQFQQGEEEEQEVEEGGRGEEAGGEVIKKKDGVEKLQGCG